MKAKGWVGWGLSPNGGMKGSDIIVGENEKLSDMHGVGNMKPVKDESQDYELLKWEKSGNFITMKFKRCDCSKLNKTYYAVIAKID